MAGNFKGTCYDESTMIWDYAKNMYAKQAQKNALRDLERQLNYGPLEEPINRRLLKRHLANLHISEDCRAFLELLVWNKPF